MSPPAQVVAVVAAFRRPELLRRLVESLASECGPLTGVVVVDNGGDATMSAALASLPVPCRRVDPGRNLGCGGGVALGLREAFADPEVSHAWILDDDVVALPGALAALLAVLEETGAGAAVPLMTDETGRIGWFPGSLPPQAWTAIRMPGATPASFVAACGSGPLTWAWAPWPSLLVTRAAVDAVGYPRSDYWFQGEDLEWTLRLTAYLPGVLAPGAQCRHLPPAVGDAVRARRKQLLMLQNNFFTATRLYHGARLCRHAPGNVARFLSSEGWSPGAVTEVGRAFWRGAIRGHPAGAPGGDGFRRIWGERI